MLVARRASEASLYLFFIFSDFVQVFLQEQIFVFFHFPKFNFEYFFTLQENVTAIQRKYLEYKFTRVTSIISGKFLQLSHVFKFIFPLKTIANIFQMCSKWISYSE